MAEFKEELVINALHSEKAEIGKKYWVSDSILFLKETVTEEKIESIETLKKISDDYTHAFVDEDNVSWEYLYPYEEPPKQRMTNRQLAEWLVKGNGEYIILSSSRLAYFNYAYSIEESNEYVSDNIKIRSWDSEEWIEPTVDIYERDCKGDKNNG